MTDNKKRKIKDMSHEELEARILANEKQLKVLRAAIARREGKFSNAFFRQAKLKIGLAKEQEEAYWQKIEKEAEELAKFCDEEEKKGTFQEKEEQPTKETIPENEESSEEEEDEDREPTCQLCGEEILMSHDKTVYLAEWLHVSPECPKCKRMCCDACLTTCYDCWNEDDDYPIRCTSCMNKEELKKIPCKYHTWYSCTKEHRDVHQDYRCGECYANYNYSGKMGGW